MFPRIYEDAKCPLDGYEALSFRVLVNPTGAEKNDWALGHMGIDGCEACAKLGTPRGKQGSSSKKYCPACTEARDRMGRSAVAVYGPSQVPGFDFGTPESALATFGQADLPDELLLWLYMLPQALWAARNDDIKKKLTSFLTTGS
jgi:hypothetical protein